MGIWRCGGLDEEEADVEKGGILQEVLEMEKGLQNVIWGFGSFKKNR